MNEQPRPRHPLAACVLCFISLAVFDAEGARTSQLCRFSGKPIIEMAPSELTARASDTARVSEGSGAEGGCVTMETSGASGVASAATPPIAVEPGRSYRVRASIRALSADAKTKICVWVREYAEPRGRPLQPYPRTSVRHRAVLDHQRNVWTLREVTFKAKEQARAIQVTLVVSDGLAQVELRSIRIMDLAALKTRDSSDLGPAMAQVQKEATKRQPILDRTLVFSRSQMKYGLERNYLRKWIDRPLLVDRSLRVPRRYVTPFPSYAKILGVVKLYDIDGLAFFPETKDRMGMFELTDRAWVEGLSLLPELIATRDLAKKIEVLEKALACKSTARVNSKILITSYNSNALKPSEWQEILVALRERFGDRFVFLPALAAPVALKGDFQAGIPIAEESIDECKASLRAYLDVCDGIYFHYAAALKRRDRTFDAEFYREAFIPVFKSVLAEPKYRHKYLGLSAYHSHYNADLSLGLQEDGTRTLRASFEAAMDARPDVLIMPEWDEVNENTCIRPTIYNSFATQRILRYYMSRIRGAAPSANPGDDLALPNLIVSFRKILTLGEKIEIELLNVPDGSPSQRYRVSVRLLNHAGRAVRDLEPVTFDSGGLTEERLSLPSGDFADSPALVPALTVEGYGLREPLTLDAGFHHIQLRATWNWDYKWVKQPIRDLLRPRAASFTFAEGTDPNKATVTVLGSLACDEEIALAEVLEDDDVVYALDPTDEFARDRADKIPLWIELRSLREQRLEGTLTVRGTHCKWHFNGVPLHQPVPSRNAEGNRVEFKTSVTCHQRWAYAIMPAADIDSATLVLDSNLAKVEVPVRQVIDKGIYSETYRDGFTFTVWQHWKQPDMPMHLNKRSVSFTARVKPELPTSQLHLRVTTKSGKTFRSRPLLLPAVARGPTTDLRVYSDSTGQPVDLRIRRVRVPDCAFDFSRERGSVLYTSAGRPFWGHLGGYVDTTTGRGGNGGGASATLFRFGTHQYPADAHVTAPSWATRDGKPGLDFDGIGNYILLPRETLPLRGPFSLSLEIMLRTTAKPQLLFAHRTHRVSSLVLYVRDGRLRGSFAGQKGHYAFGTTLQIEPGQWTKVEAIHDFVTMRLRVNGREESFPCAGPGLNLGLCVIGGYGTGGKVGNAPGNTWWLDGCLRSLRIRHNAAGVE